MSEVTITAGSTSATVDAARGFTLYSWMVDGFDYLHTEPGFPAHGKVTHSGIPILFPWPNRIADARFTWDGTDYVLPVTEAATGASLHGYAAFAGWRVVDQGPGHVTGEFLLSRDAPDQVWPADAGLRVTYRVEPTVLNVNAEVFNDDTVDLPFGLGFHPYLRVPGPFDQWLLQCDATRAWPLANMVPAGVAEPIPEAVDFRTPRRLGDQHLDDALTGLPAAPAMTQRAALRSMAATVTVSSDPAFTDYVLFTPTSRDAVAIEPYTCATDAVNLQPRGIDAGWQVLPAGRAATFAWRIDIE